MAALRTLAFLSLTGFASSQTSDCSYYGLLNHLNLTESNTALQIMRPVTNWTRATFVQVDMFMLGILEVDEKPQTFTNHITVNMAWKNEFLTWNPSEFCGIDKLTVPRSVLWVPDITIEEDVSDTGSIQQGPLVTVYSHGYMFTMGRQRLTCTCRLNLMMFPFDMQYCAIVFSSLSSDVESIRLGTISSDEVLTKVSEASMVTRGEWDLKNIEIKAFTDERDQNKSKLLYMVRLMRKPMLYVMNFIVPLLYFLAMDLASYFISESKGEKLSFKVTLLLSISVLLLILQDMLPSTENNMPMIAIYCIGIFSLVALSLLEALVVAYLIDLDGCCCQKAQSSANAQVAIELEVDNKEVSHTESTEVDENGQVKSEKSSRPSDGDLLKLILGEVKAAREEAGRQGTDNEKHGRYRRVARIIDRVFFAFYLIGCVTFLVFMYLGWIPQLL